MIMPVALFVRNGSIFLTFSSRSRPAPVPLAARGTLGCNGVRRDRFVMGPKPRQNRPPACQKHATNFWPACMRRGPKCHALRRADTAAF